MSATTNLNRYRPISSLGAGGMSTVVLAEDTVLGRRVALKRMHAGEDARRLSRLRREALIGASVSHPNLVPIYDIVIGDDGDSVIVMEYVEGQTLRDRIKREGALPVSLVLRVIEGVAAALDAIHAQGIVHRDVKPANILLGDDGSVKLADLGVASAPDRTRITTTGGVVGTFSYMSPEQLGGASATSAADVYALAAVAFEALSGRKARIEPNPLALAHSIAKAPPPDLRDAWLRAPAAAAKLLMRGMARNPKDRPKSAGELAGRLREALAPAITEPSPPRAARPAPRPAPSPPVEKPAPRAAKRASTTMAPPPAPERRDRRRLLVATLIPLLVLAGAIVAIAATTGSSPRRQASAQSHSTSTPTRTPSRSRTHSGTTARHTAAGQAGTASSTARAGSSGSTAGAAGAAATGVAATGAAAGGAAGGPTSAVERFYSLAAGHNYSAAWALADPTFRGQLGGYYGLQGTMSRVRSITFNSARTVSQTAGSATVAVQTTSVQTDRTQRCSGTVQLVPGGGGWLLHQIGISCV